MARKISLREFQENLVKRLTSAQRGETANALLGVLAGREHWLLELADSGEIVPLPHLTSVPLTRSWFCGVANIRGTLYAVVDFSAFQGGEATPQNSESRLLIVNSRHGINSALLVNRTLGLRNMEQLRPCETAQDTRPWVGQEFEDAQGRRWKKLDLRHLINQPEFLEIGV
jgi:twitching motility protein PilI